MQLWGTYGELKSLTALVGSQKIESKYEKSRTPTVSTLETEKLISKGVKRCKKLLHLKSEK